MGCNTSQEQKSAVTENNGDIDTSNETNKTARNSAKSDKSSKSAKSEKLTNGHDNKSDDSKSEEQAATKIQAVFRGHKVRASMKQGDSSANSNNTMTPPSATATSNASNDEPTQDELRAEFREDDKELCDAATRIQAAFRGHLARKVAGDEPDLKDEKDLQEITKAVAEELDIDLNDPELHRAATKIQASFRGHKARKDA